MLKAGNSVIDDSSLFRNRESLNRHKFLSTQCSLSNEMSNSFEAFSSTAVFVADPSDLTGFYKKSAENVYTHTHKLKSYF